MLSETKYIDTDVLVIGSGAAGARAAIEACEYTAKVLLVSKGVPGRSGTTNLAGVHYAAALGHADQDSPWHHFEDTIVEARWIADQDLALKMCQHGPKTVYDLERYGLNWYRQEDGILYKQLPAPGHSYNRGIHFNGKTGKMVQQSLMYEINRHPGIRLLSDIFITTIFVEDGEVAGAGGINLQSGELVVIHSNSVILATGGAGMLYKVTDMETGSTGDGIAIAYRAGAEIIAPEMHQFFPTAFVWPETLRGIAVNSSQLWKLGLRLYNAEDTRFMEQYYPEEKENMPRDILSQCIFKEIQEGRGTDHGGVWQDTRWIETFDELRRDRPRSYIWPKKLGVDVSRFEIAPTYHFTLGGVRINTNAETSVPGLFACGEIVGATHGANRLAGNALTECMVFGEIAGRNAALRALGNSMKARTAELLVNAERDRLRGILKSDPKAARRPGELFEELRHVMYFNVGIVRDAVSLQTALDQVNELSEQARSIRLADIERFNLEWIWSLELNSMLQLAGLFAKGALLRTESRGAHFRADYPNTDDANWLKNIIVSKVGNEDVYRTESVNLKHINEVHPRYEELGY